jgi:hypothetical protein
MLNKKWYNCAQSSIILCYSGIGVRKWANDSVCLPALQLMRVSSIAVRGVPFLCGFQNLIYCVHKRDIGIRVRDVQSVGLPAVRTPPHWISCMGLRQP